MIALVRKPISGRHVLYAMVGFFGVVTAVNAAFLYFAIGSHPGVITPDAYRKGLAYNATLRDADAQRALGWRGDLTAARGPDASANRYTLTLALRDGDAKPVTGLTVAGRLRRPAVDNADQTFPFDERRAGDYVARIDLPNKGNWIASVTGRRRDGTVYRLERRLWLK